MGRNGRGNPTIPYRQYSHISARLLLYHMLDARPHTAQSINTVGPVLAAQFSDQADMLQK